MSRLSCPLSWQVSKHSCQVPACLLQVLLCVQMPELGTLSCLSCLLCLKRQRDCESSEAGDRDATDPLRRDTITGMLAVRLSGAEPHLLLCQHLSVSSLLKHVPVLLHQTLQVQPLLVLAEVRLQHWHAAHVVQVPGNLPEIPASTYPSTSTPARDA